jgi:hypothetical protein
LQDLSEERDEKARFSCPDDASDVYVSICGMGTEGDGNWSKSATNGSRCNVKNRFGIFQGNVQQDTVVSAMGSTKIMLLMIDDLCEEARQEFLEFMGAQESEYEFTPIAVISKTLDDPDQPGAEKSEPRTEQEKS